MNLDNIDKITHFLLEAHAAFLRPRQKKAWNLGTRLGEPLRE
jgi:hypothetical protein